jgi:tetratricopeptide (TPR) repeat protein
MMVDDLHKLQQALGRQDWPEAETLLRGLIAGNGSHAGLHYNLGLVLRRQHKNALALSAFDAALACDQNHLSAGFERAALLLDMGDHAAAEAAFRSHLLRDPRDADARLNLARLLLRRDAAAEALEIAAGDARPEARLVEAEALRDLGRLDEMQSLVAALATQVPGLKPVLMKILSQGPRGRLPLQAVDVFSPPGTSTPP